MFDCFSSYSCMKYCIDNCNGCPLVLLNDVIVVVCLFQTPGSHGSWISLCKQLINICTITHKKDMWCKLIIHKNVCLLFPCIYVRYLYYIAVGFFFCVCIFPVRRNVYSTLNALYVASRFVCKLRDWFSRLITMFRVLSLYNDIFGWCVSCSVCKTDLVYCTHYHLLSAIEWTALIECGTMWRGLSL